MLGRLLSRFLLFLVLPSLSICGAAQSLYSARHPLADASRAAIPGSRSPLARFGRDLGPLDANRKLEGLALVLKRSPAQQADLNSLLIAQTDPHSPQYHHWLTPDTFASRFGAASADLATAQSWLTAQGFTLDATPPSHDRVIFTGTVAQVTAAFKTELHTYDLNGERHFGPSSDLTLPAAIAPLTAAVLHLSDLRPQANVRPSPEYTDATSGQHFLTPTDIATMYDTGVTEGFGGFGQSLAVVGQTYIASNNSNIPLTGQINIGYPVLVPGTGVEAAIPGDLVEAELDTEYAGGTAPQTQILYVYVGDNTNFDVFDALAFAVQQDIAPVITTSYSICETLLNSSTLASYDAILMQAAAQGQTIVAASGDSGSTGCANYTSSSLTAAQQQALTVDYPSSNPYVTAAGGTQMTSAALTPGSNSFWSAANTGPASLLSYAPETTWNEGSPTRGIVAGGGGASAIYPRPSWQTALPSIPAGTMRLVPDIALQASTSNPGYLVCTDDPDFLGTGVQGCTNGLEDSHGHYSVAGGTSFAAPIFAGMVSLLNGYEKTIGQGPMNPALYQLAGTGSLAASIFHDITSGSNACVSGAANCTAAGQLGFSAGPGFDEATGLGSIDLQQLEKSWPAAQANTSQLQPISIIFQYTGTVDASNQGTSPGSPVPVTINIGTPNFSYNTTPTGTVALYLDGVLLNGAASFTSVDNYNHAAQITVTLTAPATTGSHLLKAVYSGDATHSTASSVYPFLVGTVTATGSLTLSGNNVSLANNASTTTQITLTPTGGYHGEVTWIIGTTVSGGNANSEACYSLSPLRVNGVTTATLALGSGTACSGPLPNVKGAVKSLRKPALSQKVSVYGCGLSVVCMASCICFSRRRLGSQKLYSHGLLAAMALSSVCLCLGLGGCGGGSSATTGGNTGGNTGGGGTTPTPSSTPAVYTIGLNAHDSVNSSIMASTSITLTVN